MPHVHAPGPTRCPYSAAYRAALRAALSLTGGSVTLLAFGAAGPPAAVVSTLSVFALSGIVGYNSVWSVTPALHSPLMSVTNAISGATESICKRGVLMSLNADVAREFRRRAARRNLPPPPPRLQASLPSAAWQ